MKRKLLSLLAAVALVAALVISFATPVMAAAPVLTDITHYSSDFLYFISSSGYATYYGVHFYGTNLTGATALTFSGTGVTASITAVTDTDVTADVTVASGAAHGPRDITITTGGGTSAPLYGGFAVGEFPYPDVGSSTVGLSITPYYDAGGTFAHTVPGSTPITTPVAPGTTIWYRMTLSQENASAHDFMAGQLAVRFPANPAGHTYIPVAGYGSTTPAQTDIPEIKPGSPLIIFAPTYYTASTADLNNAGFLIAEADYGATGDHPSGINGVVEGIAPTIANGSITNSLLMTGSLRVTKSVVIPNGVQLNGINKTFTVTVTGPGGYNNPLTFTVADGVLTTPASGYYDLTGLTPGTYHVAESPGSPWSVSTNATSGNVDVTSSGSGGVLVTNTFVPGSLTVTKSVNWNGVSGTGITQNFTVNVSGPNSYSQTLTFHMVAGVVTDSPQTLNNLVPGAYTVSEADPGSAWNVSVTSSGNVTVTSGNTASSTVTNSYVVPHTTLQTMTANPPIIPLGGGNVTITVTDLNDGNVPITGAYFTLSGSPQFAGGPINMTLVSSSDGNTSTLNPNATWTFNATVAITEDTTFTAVGHGTGNEIDVTGRSETGVLLVGVPRVPASSNWSLGILILGLAGAITFTGIQRRRRSH